MPAKRLKDRLLKPVYEIHVLGGPNLNMLGFCEPEIYGTETLEDLEGKMRAAAKESPNRVKLFFFQTNYEGEMLEYIHSLALGSAARGQLSGIIANFAAWTHTSIALRDAMMMLRPIPLVEVQLSNTPEQDEFRQYSLLEDLADYRVVGSGLQGYVEALRWMLAEAKKDRLDVH
ncbi:MAG: type II 3-dehydroquinate dehydratase [Bdellovibrionota bacterium]